jgi:Ca-activated chloride channel family protein
MPKALLAAAILATATGVYAQGFDSRFEEGYTLLRAGDPDGALESFRQLLTEDPESEFVQYSIAAAQYEKGLKDLELEAPEEAIEQLYLARDGFDALRNTKDRFLRNNAPFNAANSTAQVAKHYDAHEQYNERVQALRDAIVAYEKLLRQQSEHASAKTNLNHARYLLKTMMQDPPPDQERADDEGGEEGEQGQNDQQSEGQEGENDEESEEGEQDPPEGDENQSSEDQNSGGDPQDSSIESQSLEDQNIEAILQSLEDKNREEQKNLRKAKGPPKVREGKWW